MQKNVLWSGILWLGSVMGCVNMDSGHDRLAPNANERAIAQVVEAPAAVVTGAGRPIGGKLMIIGAMTNIALGDITYDVVFTDRMAQDVGGPEHLRILVVPGASAAPTWLYTYLQSMVSTRGTPAENVELAHIASEDDDATPEVDESTWRYGAYDPRELKKLARANVVWFAGGDQSRLVALLLNTNGSATPFQAAMKERLLSNDLIIAGTSAGAAVMSDPMIGNGTSWGALTMAPDPTCESGDALCVVPGLGYIPSRFGVLVDQHFTQRGRFARLVRALALTNLSTGWGIGAEAAFYVDLQTRQAEVVGISGKAYVGIVGRAGARRNHEEEGPPFLGEGYRMSVLAAGDTYTLPDARHPHGEAMHPNLDDYYEPFCNYYDSTPIFTDALAPDVLVDNIATYVADGAPQETGARVDALALDVAETGAATGFLFRFTADDQTEAAWNEDTGYSVYNARMKISTVAAQISGIQP